MNQTIAFLFVAGILLVAAGCTTQSEETTTSWQYQEATNNVEANDMMKNGWTVAGFSNYTAATGQPQSTYIMKRPKR